MAKAGLYESLLTDSLLKELELIDEKIFSIGKKKLHPGEVGDRLAIHLGKILMYGLSSVTEKDRVEVGMSLVRELIAAIDSKFAKEDVSASQLAHAKEFLASILLRSPDGSVGKVAEPLTPLLDTTLLTNARGEPRVGAQILTEIDSADRIDIIMAFVRVSGIRPFLQSLRRYTGGALDGRKLRILTTTYTGSTELKALELLRDLGAQVKVSYDTSSSRLHAKAWHFHRDTGASTAYIGSSNLTYSAQESGIEWNVRVSGLRNPDVIRKITSMFDAYWEEGDFRRFDAEEFSRETTRKADSGPAIYLSPIEIELKPFQERLLERINVARGQGHHRNLLVSATGTGKTVMAAVDYCRLRGVYSSSRLLFVAHREEILDQSLAIFRHALRDASFGEKWTGNHRPQNYEHVFASIQSLNAADLSRLDTDHFDIVIIDEFHHAAAPSYTKVLSHVQPKELLGLTATPERTDGLSVLDWFDGRIAAELRLWDAIDQHRLVPFTYYGIHDGLDLRDIPWRRGRGYDIAKLSNLYTADDAWVRRVIKELDHRVSDVNAMKALGFCVSIQHAKFMAQRFRAAGISAVAVWGDTPDSERRAALKQLADGTIQILFSVDLFNEGVDVPSVDTLLLLRPTESATLFLQQLGRGLRRSSGKSVCTVLDFVGLHRREFRFDRRLSALLGGSRRFLRDQVEQSFPFLPAGCHMELDAKASEIVLESLKSALPDRWSERIAELRAMVDAGVGVSLKSFLLETGLELADVYKYPRCWSDFLEAANMPVLAAGPHEALIRRAIGRMLHVDDEERLGFYLKILDPYAVPDLAEMSIRERRMVRMMVAPLCDKILRKEDSLEQGIATLWMHSQVLSELKELFSFLRDQIDHIHSRLETHPDVPLQVHAKYTRIEILGGFGVGDHARTQAWREGALWIEKDKVDVFAFTLDKSDGSFSPTTMYRDYAISRDLIHWESQSSTSKNSPAGKRYCNHVAHETEVMLFARETAADRAFWFLGSATYVSHQSERPMGITWKLKFPLPGDLYASFVAAVA